MEGYAWSLLRRALISSGGHVGLNPAGVQVMGGAEVERSSHFIPTRRGDAGRLPCGVRVVKQRPAGIASSEDDDASGGGKSLPASGSSVVSSCMSIWYHRLCCSITLLPIISNIFTPLQVSILTFLDQFRLILHISRFPTLF